MDSSFNSETLKPTSTLIWNSSMLLSQLQIFSFFIRLPYFINSVKYWPLYISKIDFSKSFPVSCCIDNYIKMNCKNSNIFTIPRKFFSSLNENHSWGASCAPSRVSTLLVPFWSHRTFELFVVYFIILLIYGWLRLGDCFPPFP